MSSSMSTKHCSTRRDFLRQAGGGLGMLAMSSLLQAQEHFAPKAKSVIWLFMEGGPSGFDLFDYKPELQKNAGKRVDGIETFFGNPGPLLKSPYSFRQYGESGAYARSEEH